MSFKVDSISQKIRNMKVNSKKNTAANYNNKKSLNNKLKKKRNSSFLMMKVTKMIKNMTLKTI